VPAPARPFDAIEQHVQETKGHIETLDQIFEKLRMPATGKKREA